MKLLLLLLAGAAALLVVRLVVARQIHRWLPAYLRGLFHRRPAVSGPIDVMVCVADHFEPAWNNAPLRLQRQRVATWERRLPVLARNHRDADGKPFQHTFFYPAEEYLPEHLDALSRLCRSGYGDVEVHLHHDDDTADNLRNTLTGFTEILYRRHGLLRRNPRTGLIDYAFIHGNWALDNCRPDGRYCGVNNELTVLLETGCYMDLTFPSAPDPTQPGKINAIYYAADDPGRPASHARGRDVEAASEARPGELLIVQGPLTLNWGNRVRGVFPRVENGELTGDNPPTPARADLWVRQHVHVRKQPSWVFVKLHTHGADERDTRALLDGPLDRTLTYLEQRYNDGTRYRLHYVTAREMFSIIRAAEAGCTGNAGHFRTFADPAGSHELDARETLAVGGSRG
jgi:hypothetical protein